MSLYPKKAANLIGKLYLHDALVPSGSHSLTALKSPRLIASSPSKPALLGEPAPTKPICSGKMVECEKTNSTGTTLLTS